MVEPTIVARSGHTLSRRNIDPDALKVLHRLRAGGFAAYLVGGSVRDLLLGRRPKDFDVGTDAHPYQIRKLFRNCWIIGRRFRLAHVKFGSKIIEVATFRRDVTGEPEAPPSPAAHLHRENTFGTPEEDAFRRDFTVNGLFYDIATFAIIDYVGGLSDLEARLLRSIGDPDVRFQEDPVRMLRAIVLAARLDFRLDPPILEAIARRQSLIATAAPARLLEEYYKILRSGASARTFLALGRSGLLRHITPELDQASPALSSSLRALDAYRARFSEPPVSLTNTILAGTLLAPLRLIGPPRWYPTPDAPTPPRAALGLLAVARRDVEQLRQIVALEPRLLDPQVSPRAQRQIVRRPAFGDALTWLEIHAGRQDVVETWRTAASHVHAVSAQPSPDHSGQRRRRRRRRGRRSRVPPPDKVKS